jgi:hypothetical protein
MPVVGGVFLTEERLERLKTKLMAAAEKCVAEAIAANPEMKDVYLRRLATYQPIMPTESDDGTSTQ